MYEQTLNHRLNNLVKEKAMSEANKKQVAGDHYKTTIQHWDYVIANDLDYFQAQITKYVTRYKKKNGLQDLYKAQHFLEKLIEIEENKNVVVNNDVNDREDTITKDELVNDFGATGEYVNQDR